MEGAPGLAHRIAHRRYREPLGLQLDYDSPTGKLGGYIQTLAKIRAELPAGTELSVTGLPDWFRSDIWREQSSRLENISVFYQLYRGKKTERNIEAYLKASQRYPLPFRIGLLENQTLTPGQQKLRAENKNFRGTVIFLGAK